MTTYLPVLLSKNLMCLSSWAVIVTGSVGWLTTLLMCLLDCKPESICDEIITSDW